MIGIVQRDVEKFIINGESFQNFKAECFYGKQIIHYNIEHTIKKQIKGNKINHIDVHNTLKQNSFFYNQSL